MNTHTQTHSHNHTKYTPSLFEQMWIKQSTCRLRAVIWRHFFKQKCKKKNPWKTRLLNLESSQPGCFIYAVMGLMWHSKCLATLIITLLFGDGCYERFWQPMDVVHVWVIHWVFGQSSNTFWKLSHYIITNMHISSPFSLYAFCNNIK